MLHLNTPSSGKRICTQQGLSVLDPYELSRRGKTTCDAYTPAPRNEKVSKSACTHTTHTHTSSKTCEGYFSRCDSPLFCGTQLQTCTQTRSSSSNMQSQGSQLHMVAPDQQTFLASFFWQQRLPCTLFAHACRNDISKSLALYRYSLPTVGQLYLEAQQKHLVGGPSLSRV